MAYGKDDKTQTTTTSPYGPAQAGVQNVLSGAEKLYNSNKKANAPLNWQTQSALNQTTGLAGQPVAGLAEAKNFNTGLLADGGWTPEMRQVQANLNRFASGQYNEDPRLQRQLDINANRATNGAATRFGGGRYGSAAIGQGVGNAVADANNGVMLQSNENSRNREMQANGLLGQYGEGARSAGMQAGAMLPMFDNLGYSPAERLAGVGDFYQGRAQQQWDWPQTKLNNYANTVGHMGGMGGTVSKPKAGSGAQSAIGGAVAGAKLGNDVLPGGWGAVIGGVGGGLLGYGSY